MSRTVRRYTAFQGNRRLISGSPLEVALAIREAPEHASVLVFDDTTGRSLDIDTRGTLDELKARLSPSVDNPEAATVPRGRGRPRLGVVAREVTLLPRHWDWLSHQPGGASVALRTLVESARRQGGDSERVRSAQEAAFHFMTAMAGDLPGFEEATRALFAYDRRRFGSLIAAWPEDVRDHAIELAFADLDPDEG